MTRKTKAFWIGFLAPVILGWGYVMFTYVRLIGSHNEHAGLIRQVIALVVGGPSIPLGLVIGSIAAACTQNKLGPPKCGKCGYSLVGLTSDKCPECGQELSAMAKP